MSHRDMHSVLRGIRSMLRSCALTCCLTLLVAMFVAPAASRAQEAAPAAPAATPMAEAPPASSAPADPVAALTTNASALRIGMDTMWVLIAGMLVFWMNAGFALVESGLCQQKNCTNILAKNFVVFAASALSFWVIGWGLMFGDGSPYMGEKGLFFLSGADNSPALGKDYMAMNPFS